ncbi:MAG: protein-glutamate O-methyltransferase CheR [Desulfobacterales bacterium]|nr:protein-glutamate O-methyltransferase CheR [Desulfobacterales bacterium]
MNQSLASIFTYLSQCFGIDFPERRIPFFKNKIQERLRTLRLHNLDEYFRYIKASPEEPGVLLDILTVNYSTFFRNPLAFDYLFQKLLPAMMTEERRMLRVWSAGCAMGEEPYTVAIMISEIRRKLNLSTDVRIFGTDINPAVIEKALKGTYQEDQIKYLRYDLVRRFFQPHGDGYRLAPEIKEMVNFSPYDMMDPKTYVPPESVFGNFDLVLCRNLLIYFSKEKQEMIMDKLYRSLSSGGVLVLGEAETPTGPHVHKLKRKIPCCQIYVKSKGAHR